MVQLIAGKKGTGKSKELVKHANSAAEDAKGSIIFIDDDRRPMYDLDHKVRFISMEEFPIEKADEFLGFLCGLISNNYDIEKIYIDGILNCTTIGEEALPNWFNKIDDISTAFDIDFEITLSRESEVPEPLKRYLS